MKKLFKNYSSKKVQAFTLVEMLMVLVVISVLLLLFVPNVSKQKEVVQEKGGEAIVKVVESQAELYEMKHDDKASLSKLLEMEAITSKQVKAYNEYYANHTEISPRVVQ